MSFGPLKMGAYSANLGYSYIDADHMHCHHSPAASPLLACYLCLVPTTKLVKISLKTMLKERVNEV